MKYMLLIYVDQQIWEKVSETDRQQMVDDSVKLANQISSSGQYLAAARLQQEPVARFPRQHTGRPVTTRMARCPRLKRIDNPSNATCRRPRG